jgi:hypothetical protein
MGDREMWQVAAFPAHLDNPPAAVQQELQLMWWITSGALRELRCAAPLSFLPQMPELPRIAEMHPFLFPAALDHRRNRAVGLHFARCGSALAASPMPPTAAGP